MPAPAGTKRVRGAQIFRPFIYGTEAIPWDPANPPKDAAPEHTHRWKVFVRGINNEDISYWLRKVQFKLHDSFPNSLRMIESPPFEIEETGWGEFELGIRLYFVPEANEKPAQIWHHLKLHPYTGDLEAQKENRTMIKSLCYEEIVFNEPVEQFYEILTGGGARAKASKATKPPAKGARDAQIPDQITKDNVFSHEEETKELDRLGEAFKKVKGLIEEEKVKLVEGETRLQELEKTEGKANMKKK